MSARQCGDGIGGNFRTSGKFTTGGSTNAELFLTKLGGAGDFGDPQPLGSLAIGCQGRLRGNMGYLEATNHLHSPLLEGDINTYKLWKVQWIGIGASYVWGSTFTGWTAGLDVVFRF